MKLIVNVLAGQYGDIIRQQRVHSLYEAIARYSTVNMNVKAEPPSVNARISTRTAVYHGRLGFQQLSYRLFDDLLNCQRVVLSLKSVIIRTIICDKNL